MILQNLSRIPELQVMGMVVIDKATHRFKVINGSLHDSDSIDGLEQSEQLIENLHTLLTEKGYLP